MSVKTRIGKLYNQFFLTGQVPAADIARLNNQRVLIIALVLIPIHLGYIIFFWLTNQLYAELIFAHGAVLIIIALMGLITLNLRKNKSGDTFIYHNLAPGLAAAYLLFGAALYVLDEPLIAGINPYLIASIAAAAVIIMKPGFAAFIYGLTYLALYLNLPLNQLHSKELLSLRLDGAAAAAIGLGLSLMLWRINALNILQKNLLKRQNKLLQKQQEEINHMARTDMMTGLYNRMRITEYLESEIERINRTGEESSLILLDLDHFNEVNDFYGHPNGDIVLQLMAGVIKGQLRKTDIPARFSGEEFMIILPGTSLEGALRVAEKIRQAIEGCTFTGKMEDLHMTASCGVVPINQDQKATSDSVYQKASRALSSAKSKGRNRVEAAC